MCKAMSARAVGQASLVTLLATLVPALGQQASFEGRVQIGGTGINCVREPCPRIGIMAANNPGKPHFVRPMFAGPNPPPMKGSEADIAQVRAAWRVDSCLFVEGRFSRPPLLEIHTIAGSCRPNE